MSHTNNHASSSSERQLRFRRVAVSAGGSVSAAGLGVVALRSALSEGRSHLRLGDDLPDGIGTLPFSATVGVVPGELRALRGRGAFPATRQLRLAEETVRQIEPEVRRALGQYGPERVGLVLGTSTGGIHSTEEALLHLRRRGHLPADFSCFDGHNMDAAARAMGQGLGLLGPVFAVSAACASGAKALATARRLIELGICDAVVAGGVDSICRMTLHGFHSLGVLSEANCRPFDDTTYGMNVAEGGALLLLEPVTAETAAGAIVLRGVGESSDAYHMSAPDPSGESQARSMTESLRDAGLSSSGIGYVNAHGTGTRANDTAEALALSQVTPGVPASSTKGLLGHQLGAAGATEALIAVQVLEGLSLAPTGAIQKEQFPFAVPTLAMSNSFAFGGANISLTFAREDHVEVAAPGLPPELSAGIVRAALVESADLDDRKAWGKEILAPRARARASELTRLGAHLVLGLGLSKEELAEVPFFFGSALGQIRTTRRLIELFLDGDSSPLAFQSSVHNAVVGALSLALSNKKPSSSVAGGRDTTFAVFLEALSYLWTHPRERRAVVLCLDEEPPEDLGVEPYSTSGAAFLVERAPVEGARRVQLRNRSDIDPQTIVSHCTPSPTSDALEWARAVVSGSPAVLASGLSNWAFEMEPIR